MRRGIAPPSAVIDTQLLIRGLHTARGDSGRLVRALAEERFRLVISEPLLRELARSLGKPAVQKLGRGGPLTAAGIDEAVDAVRALAWNPRAFLVILTTWGEA